MSLETRNWLVENGFTPQLNKRDQTLQELSLFSDEEQLAFVKSLRPGEYELLFDDDSAWDYILRPDQLAPTVEKDWRIWLSITSRGWGKNAMGSYWVCNKIKNAKHGEQGAIVSQSITTAKKYILNGDNGLFTKFAHLLPKIVRRDGVSHIYEFENGATLHILTSENPSGIYGANFSWAWCDELLRYSNPHEVFNDGLKNAVRKSRKPQILITTNPRAAYYAFLKQLRAERGLREQHGKIFDNYALPVDFLEASFKETYSRSDREMILGEILEDGGLIFKVEFIQHKKVNRSELSRVVVGVDPATSIDGTTGIVVVGIKTEANGVKLDQPEAYVLADRSIKGTPQKWAKAVERAYLDFEGSRIVAESNQGGLMVESTLRQVNPNLPIKLLTAAQSKGSRAEPVGALYEQSRIFHLNTFLELENQMLDFEPQNQTKGNSPDRMDAMVHAITELMLKKQGSARVLSNNMNPFNYWY